jgi:hypothetical protein
MPYTLLFNAGCVACSNAAREIVEMGIAGLEVRPLSDPAVVDRLRQAGLEPPDRPALLADDGDQLRIATGWAMRVALVRLAGWNRADRIVRLLSIEQRARMSRGRTISRRTALGGGLAALAAAIGSAILPRSATTALAATDGVTTASATDVQRALAAQSVSAAIGTWGPVLPEVQVATQGTESVLVFGFQNNPNVVLLVDNTTAAKPSNTAALGMSVLKTGSGVIRFYDTTGQALVDLSVQSNTLVVTQVAPASALTEFGQDLLCFIHCLIQGNIDVNCILACISCAEGGFGAIFNCPRCFLCAGLRAIHCFRECFP